MTFGEQLGAWIREARISASELERRIGRSSGYLSRLMDGRIRPTEETCGRLALALGRAGLRVTRGEVLAAAAPAAADPWVREFYERRIRDLSYPGRLEELEEENCRLRRALENSRRALEGL